MTARINTAGTWAVFFWIAFEMGYKAGFSCVQVFVNSPYADEMCFVLPFIDLVVRLPGEFVPVSFNQPGFAVWMGCLPLRPKRAAAFTKNRLTEKQREVPLDTSTLILTAFVRMSKDSGSRQVV